LRHTIAAAFGLVALAFGVAAPAAASPYSREYHRGYRDCLAGRFDEEQHSHAYRRGCRAAEREQQRGREPAEACPPDVSEADRYRYPGCEGMGERDWRRRAAPVPNVAPPVGVPRVTGMDSIQSVAAMASRGYRNVGTNMVGAAVLGIYFNPVTGECVQLTNANGRVIDAREIGTHPRCR